MSKKINKTKIIHILIFSLYEIITFITIFHHEAWRDEAQAWLIARDLNIFEIISELKYEGHFLLWYLILLPFAKLGFPYITTNIISQIITSIAVWLILEKSPFKLYEKILIIFSYPMIYLYPVVSGCYCLIPLAISLIAIFYKERKQKPIRYILSIVLLANTHTIMLGMVGVLLIEYYGEQFLSRKKNSKEENKKIIMSFVLVCTLLLITALPLLNCSEASVFSNLDSRVNNFNIEELLTNLVTMFYNNYMVYLNNYIIIFAIGIALLLSITIAASYYTKEFLKITIILMWELLLYCFVCGLSEQLCATIIFIIVFYIWITIGNIKDKKDIPDKFNRLLKYSMMLLVILNISQGISSIYLDFKYDYSSAYKVANYIDENIEEGSLILTGNMPECSSSVIPYLNKNVRFYYAQTSKEFTFNHYDKSMYYKLEDDFLDNLNIDSNQRTYYIFSKYVTSSRDNIDEIVENLVKNGKLEIIYETYGSIKDEDYILYKINQ